MALEDGASTSLERDILALVMLAGFLPYCFAGEKLFKGSLVAVGFATAGYAAFWLVDTHADNLEPEARLVIVLCSGILGALIVISAYHVSVFSAGAVAGVLASNAIFQIATKGGGLPSENVWHGVIVAIGGLASGVLMIAMLERIIRISTALAGSYMGIAGGEYLVYKAGWVGQVTLTPPTFFFRPQNLPCSGYPCASVISAWAVVFVLGLLVQFEVVTVRRCFEGRPAPLDVARHHAPQIVSGSSDFELLSGPVSIRTPSRPKRRRRPRNRARVGAGAAASVVSSEVPSDRHAR